MAMNPEFKPPWATGCLGAFAHALPYAWKGLAIHIVPVSQGPSQVPPEVGHPSELRSSGMKELLGSEPEAGGGGWPCRVIEE